jgi:hypothetical protein
MIKSTILPQVMDRLETVTFDVNNREHLEAFRMLTDRRNSRQHPRLRFRLEHPYIDVRAMLYDKVGQAFLASQGLTA